MSSNKTISINPELFSLSKVKTRKKREKKEKPKIKPIISPNVLKKKLLKRIKEHKQNEIENYNENKKQLIHDNNTNNTNNTNKNDGDFNDEFADSIQYLQTLSQNAQKGRIELQKQKQKNELERKTVRNYHSLYESNHTSMPLVQLDLPAELQEYHVQPVIKENIQLNTPYKGDNIPYGILKGGVKPSYRQWKQTQKNTNHIYSPPTQGTLQIKNNPFSNEKTVRENRLNHLKEKIKQKIHNTTSNEKQTNEVMIKKPIGEFMHQENNTSFDIKTDALKINQDGINKEIINDKPLKIEVSNNTIVNNNNNNNINNELNKNKKHIATKHITKKTIKRKYTLGKSTLKRKIGILIKDRNTRKNIINAHRELKRKNINDIKLYLREHNLIKIGSNAPNDVLRKIYESAILSGDIQNNNSDTLLYNFSKDTKDGEN